MKIKGRDVRSNFTVGDSVWACAYSFASNKETKTLYQEPIRGEFTAGRNISHNDVVLKRCADMGIVPEISYFVPYKKNGTGLAWSKAVETSSRMYATTYDECVELYNDKIEEYIKWCEDQIDELKKMKI